MSNIRAKPPPLPPGDQSQPPERLAPEDNQADGKRSQPRVRLVEHDAVAEPARPPLTAVNKQRVGSAKQRGASDSNRRSSDKGGIPVVFSGTEIPDADTQANKILMLNVHKNADDINPPLRITLKKYDLWNITRAKDAIGAKVQVDGGYIKSVRTLSGEPIEHVADFEYNGYYVAVGPHEHFRKVNYSPEGRERFFVSTKIKDPYRIPERENHKAKKEFVVMLNKHGEECAPDTKEECEKHIISDYADEDGRSTSYSHATVRSGHGSAVHSTNAFSSYGNLSERSATSKSSAHSQRSGSKSPKSASKRSSHESLAESVKSEQGHQSTVDAAGDFLKKEQPIREALQYAKRADDGYKGAKEAIQASQRGYTTAKERRASLEADVLRKQDQERRLIEEAEQLRIAEAANVPRPDVDLHAAVESVKKKKNKFGCC